MSGRKLGAKLDLAQSSSDVLSRLDTAELKNIFNDPRKLNELIADHPIYLNLKAKRDELIAENRSLADFNLSREESLREAREKFIRSQNKMIEKKKEADTAKRTYGGLRHFIFLFIFFCGAKKVMFNFFAVRRRSID